MNFFSDLWQVNVPGLTEEEGAQVVVRALDASRIYQDNREMLQALGEEVSRSASGIPCIAAANPGHTNRGHPRKAGIQCVPQQAEGDAQPRRVATMLLNEQERDKFAAYLEQSAHDDNLMVATMEKVAHYPKAVIQMKRNDALAFGFVAARLRSIEFQTAGPETVKAEGA